MPRLTRETLAKAVARLQKFDYFNNKGITAIEKALYKHKPNLLCGKKIYPNRMIVA
jgi:hypothetical protein